MLTERDRYNLCVHSFVDHDYESAMALATDLVREGTQFLLYMVTLLTTLHLKKTKVLKDLGNFLLTQAPLSAWEQAVIRFVIDTIDDATLLAKADSDARRAQAHYYLGARRLVKKDFPGARDSFLASTALPKSCMEQEIAQLELRYFTRYATSDEMLWRSPVEGSGAKIWDFEALSEKLASEDRPGFVYRGQPRHYGSLLPSGYRTTVDMSQPVMVRRGEESLHNRGRTFRPLLPNSLWPEVGRRRIDFVSLCRSHFGYPLSQLFCQHCCLPTEGLDVSDSPDIAAFFAIFDYASNQYLCEGTGVVFRITVPAASSLSMQRLKEIDYYSCPFHLSGVEILRLFETCGTEIRSLQSFAEYFREKQAQELETELTVDELRTSRPFEVILLPEHDTANGRVMMQRAGLVFPDSLLPRSFQWRSFPPPVGKTWEGPHSIEDLASSDLVETFLFRHDQRNASQQRYNPATVFPQVDPLRSLLSQLPLIMAGGVGSMITASMDTSVFSSWDEEDLTR